MRLARVKKELETISREPLPGIAVWPGGTTGSDVSQLEALILGPEDSPYAGGNFRLTVTVPERYPFEPPCVRFVTKVFHPNIDGCGRICLDSLKMPPKGLWQPSLNISQILSQVRLLLVEPNVDDPLMAEISDLYRTDLQRFERVARQHTQTHAVVKKQVGVSSPVSKEDRSENIQNDRIVCNAQQLGHPEDDVKLTRKRSPSESGDGRTSSKKVNNSPVDVEDP